MSNSIGKFKINRLITLDFLIKEHPIEDIENKKDDINLAIKSSFHPEPQENLLFVDIFLEAVYKREKKSYKLFNLNNRVVFELKDINHVLDKKINEKGRQLLTTLASIAFSTTRGTLNEKLRGSRYDSFILPIVNPTELVPKSLIKTTKQEKVEKESVKDDRH
ncbi:MAG: hypothetical protein WD037_11400 [Balneolales bacterium]